MRKKQSDVSVEEEWEVDHDVVIRKPLGVTLPVRLDHQEIDQIATLAESFGLTPLEFVRQAALLVANGSLLWDRLARSDTRERRSGIAAGPAVDRISG